MFKLSLNLGKRKEADIPDEGSVLGSFAIANMTWIKHMWRESELLGSGLPELTLAYSAVPYRLG